MKISVVIPMYGCRAAVSELHRRLVETLEQITEDFEIIMVNDNCPQNSWEIIEDICSLSLQESSLILHSIHLHLPFQRISESTPQFHLLMNSMDLPTYLYQLINQDMYYSSTMNES